MENDIIRVERKKLEKFCKNIFTKLSLTDEDAHTAALVLVAADALGIPSHGTGRLWRYVNGLKTGLMLPCAEIEIISNTSSSIVINAHGAMGAPVSVKTMQSVIEKAHKNGSAFGCVRDSNHFGIAGYYARMAANEDLIGIAMTNTAALGVPTFGSRAMFGTNPMAFAIPANKEPMFVLDMATTVVTRGKIEVYEKLGKKLPEGWAVDKNGLSAKNAHDILEQMNSRAGGGILPLGGLGTLFGGYKGYGLAVLVDILCSVLCGASFGLGLQDTEDSSARVSHFFGAIKISSFRDVSGFKKDMDLMLKDLRNCPPAKDCERVYYAGLPEYETEKENNEKGIPLITPTYKSLCSIGKEYNLSL
jgi:L-2-hydroxycarboxylate dehydrogenase (NAD+)